MITTAEIQKKAEQLYPGILKATITGEVVFPKNIRSDKSLAKDFAMMSREIAHIMADSKDRKGFGYRVVSEQVKHRQHGVQDIPKAIVFETRDDYLRYTGKVKEFQQFQHNLELILSTIPILKDWCFKNPLSIIHEAERWPDILKVCQWFMSSHEINRYYIRELPISVHTKFIETNIGIFRSLLDELLPHLSNIQENVFQKRFQLKYQQPLIRIRFLDAHIAIDNRFSDVSIPLNDFAQANFDCQNLLITENLMTFLTLPPLKNTIAIWGGGYAVKNLQCIEWLKDKHLFYWGDIDIQGFEILSQLRGYYPQTISLMMDQLTFNEFKLYHGPGKSSNIFDLVHLTETENDLYRYIRLANLRFEQEKIPQTFINKLLSSILDIDNAQ